MADVDTPWYGSRERLIAAIREDWDLESVSEEKRNELYNLSADDLANVHESFRQHVLRWLETKTYDPTLTVQGYTIDRFREEQAQNVLGAISLLNALFVDPERTREMLSRKAPGIIISI